LHVTKSLIFCSGNQNQHAYKYPSCAIFFPWFFSSFHIFSSNVGAISLPTNT